MWVSDDDGCHGASLWDIMVQGNTNEMKVERRKSTFKLRV